MFLTRKLFYYMSIIFFYTFSLLACALPEDNKEKVYIVADSNVYNYKTGVNIFEGHVKVDQGTTHITADRLITKTNMKHKIQEAIAYGFNQRAHYWTLAKKDQPVIHAYANVIKFYPMEFNVAFEKNVTIQQGNNNFILPVFMFAFMPVALIVTLGWISVIISFVSAVCLVG